MADQIFKNRAEVWRYLDGEGWKVTRQTLYNHSKRGMLRGEKDGSYTLKNVLKYARLHLTTKETKGKIDDDELLRKKTLAEVARITEHAKMAQLKRMVEENKYIPRESLELELAARAAVLETGLKGMIHTRAGEWVGLVGGEEKKIPDLVNDMMTELDRTLNEFATTKEFHVIFECQPGE